MKKLIIGLLIGTILSAFVLTVTGYIDLRSAIAQGARPTPVIIVGENGGPSSQVKILVTAEAITTNTSTTPVAGVLGIKTFQWVVTGTGSVTQTVVLKGSFDSDGAYPTDLCTITLSGTAPVSDVCDPFTAPFPYLFVTTTNTTGTGASGTGRVGY